MTLRSYIWSLRTSTFFVFCSWCAIIFFTDPVEMGAVAYALFYINFFLFAAGVCVIILTAMWHRMARDVISVVELGVALRQGMLIGLLMCLILGLQQMRILVWWDALLITAAVLLIELFFLTRQSQ